MQPSIKVLTLGVNDLERSLAFYCDDFEHKVFGLATTGIVGTEFAGGAVVFFEMNGGLIFALYPKTQIAKDANLPVAQPVAQSGDTARAAASAASFTIGHNVNAKAEVDAVMAQARNAGATIADPARDRAGGGYSGHS